MSWMSAELDFASLFSYRMPNLSPGYAPASPVPSPAALRLALVDVAIKSTGKVAYGEEIFEVVKAAPMEIEPPERVAVLKFFIKRLKPSKPPKIGVEESFGVREYCHFWGTLKVFIDVSDREEEIAALFTHLRRLGTTDSLTRCLVNTDGKGPEPVLTCKEPLSLKTDVSNFTRRPVCTLNELKPDAAFSQVNPYATNKKGNPFNQKTFVLPLVEERRGENWILYKKAPFVI